jgi:tetratricopeptide (TPR) repeat protein
MTHFMNSPGLRACVGALIGILLAACAQSPPKLAPVRQDAAVEANRRAEAQFRRGNFEGAVQYYREALRISQSIEDAEGIAANAINLSIAYQRQGKFSEARASLAPVIDQNRLVFSQARLAQAALRRAVLDLDEHHDADAVQWAARAAGHCTQGCAVSGAINNVKAQLALDAGRLDEASASAKAALAASRAAEDRAEAANALRLLGGVAIRAGDAAAARTSLDEAFAIDKELALPRKMSLDLIGLGRAGALRGDAAAARGFYERALAVSEADRDGQGAAEARALIEALGKK